VLFLLFTDEDKFLQPAFEDATKQLLLFLLQFGGLPPLDEHLSFEGSLVAVIGCHYHYGVHVPLEFELVVEFKFCKYFVEN
jgi:hypothetical protein